MIHKFYPTKQHLSKMKNDTDVNCTFCQKHPETYSHLFWSCEFTYKFWRDLHKYVTDSIFADFHLYYKNIIFGFHNFNQKDNKAFFLINMLLLLAKFHIHKAKFTNRKPELFVFLKELQQYMRTIASSKNTKALKTISICNSFNLYKPTWTALALLVNLFSVSFFFALFVFFLYFAIFVFFYIFIFVIYFLFLWCLVHFCTLLCLIVRCIKNNLKNNNNNNTDLCTLTKKKKSPKVTSVNSIVVRVSAVPFPFIGSRPWMYYKTIIILL